MRNLIPLVLFSLLFNLVSAQKTYKLMMDDMSINFYDVCNEADKYFETHEKNVKGSGYKPYQRWKNANEYKYFPSGDRSKIDPFFTENAYKSFLENNPKAKQNLLVAPSAPPSPYNSGWAELGPYRIDSLTGHYAAGLGRIEDHYVNPNNANIMYVGSRSGGFWRTTDGGNNWQGTTDFLFATGVNAIGVSPTNSDSVLINVRNSRNGNSHGLYRSVDGGLTWLQSNFNPINVGSGGLGDNWKINKVKYHPRVPNLIFISASDGLYRSADNLATWTKITTGSISEIEFHPTNNNIVYIYDYYYWNTNKNVVLRSVDQGLSFSPSNTVVGNNDNTSVRFSVSNACNNCLYWASLNGVWKSTDNGMNFSFISNSTESCQGFAVNDMDTTKMIYGYVDIDRSADGGQTWSDATRWSLGNTNGTGGTNQSRFETATNYVHADLRTAKSVNGEFYVGTDGFFAKSSDNGVTWVILNQGMAVRENYKLGASQSNHYRSISGSQDNGTSIKHENAWLEFNGGDGMEGLIHPLNDEWILGSYQYGSRYLSKNGGQSSGGINAPGQSGLGNGAWEAPIAYDPNNQMTLYNFSKYIYRSEDFGSSWDSIGAPTTFTNTIGHAEIAQNNSNIIIISSGDKIEKSTDAGVTFFDIKGSLPGSSIQDIAFDPNDDNTIIVVYASYQNNGEKVYRTTDGGTTWTNITNNLGDMPVRSVVIDHLDASNIYLGAEIGVFTMPMNATTWALYNPNLPNCTIEELEVVNGSNTLKGATWGRGMWEYTLVGRNTFPSIVTTRITDQPTASLPKENVDQYITSKVSYSNTLSSVFVKWSTDTAIFNNTIAMTNTIDSTWVSNTAIPNQVFGTKIFFKVFAVGNSNDTTETYKFMYTVKENTYCTSGGTINFQGNVTLVNFNEINNSSGKTAPYTDYTDTDSTSVFIGNNYDITVNLNTDGGNYKYYATAWIDWNQDLVFDTIEMYQIGWAQNVSNLPTNLSPLTISVPATAMEGRTRMRVVCKYNSYQTDPCAQGYDGEVEDYTIIVVPVPDLAVSVSETILCENEKIHFNYTGDLVDNVIWTFSNGTNSFTSNNFADSLTILNSGSYDLNLLGILGTDTFMLDTMTLFTVNEESSFDQYFTTCEPLLADTTISILLNAAGCDSTLTTYTTLLQSSSFTQNLSTCDSSLAGITIDTLMNAIGCDSILNTVTTYFPYSFSTQNLTSCDISNVGTVIDTLINATGCDSILTSITTLLPSSSFTENLTTCNPLSAGTTIDTLVNAVGCDSILTSITTLLPSSSFTQNITTCQAVNVGTSIDTLVNSVGCDSILTSITTLLPSSSFTENLTTCVTNNAGIIIDTLINSVGCDSILTSITSLLPNYNDTVFATTCNPLNVGTVVDNNTTALGCDSIVTTITTLLSSSSFTENLTTCNAANVGTVITTLTNTVGCDSVLTTITTLSFNSSYTQNLTTCIPANAGTVVTILTNSVGCDSVLTTITSLLQSSSFTQTLTTCIPGNEGTVVNHLVNSVGCDSVLTVITTLSSSSSFTQSLTTCNVADVGTETITLANYLGCDSVLTTITSFTESYNDTVLISTCIPGEIGTEVDVNNSINGCDSTTTTITSLENINPTISINGNVLTALPSGLNYQWLICEPNIEPIVGANNQNFTVTNNGTYAVEISDGNCTETSSCIQVKGVGIVENNFTDIISIYPNPTNGYLTIEVNGGMEDIQIMLTNSLGQEIISRNEMNSPINLDISDHSAGIYFLSLKSKGNSALFRILKSE